MDRYFRSGAPPVINPLYTRFPRDTVVPGSFAVTLTWTLPNRTTGAFNVTSPLPGDWFLAAHLPKDEGKISVKVSLVFRAKVPACVTGQRLDKWSCHRCLSAVIKLYHFPVILPSFSVHCNRIHFPPKQILFKVTN